jgi:CubicO group peptidase (beta-lactamase class C family)
MSYNDYVETNVFEAAGMNDSAFLSLDRPNRNIATGYMKCLDDADVWCSNVHIMEIDGGPSGGSYSSASDLYRFDRALRENKLLPREYTHWFFSDEWPGEAATASIPDEWPMGAFAGGAEGVSTVFFSDGEWFICVLCNYDAPIAEEVGKLLYKALMESSKEDRSKS